MLTSFRSETISRLIEIDELRKRQRWNTVKNFYELLEHKRRIIKLKDNLYDGGISELEEEMRELDVRIEGARPLMSDAKAHFARYESLRDAMNEQSKCLEEDLKTIFKGLQSNPVGYSLAETYDGAQTELIKLRQDSVLIEGNLNQTVNQIVILDGFLQSLGVAKGSYETALAHLRGRYDQLERSCTDLQKAILLCKPEFQGQVLDLLQDAFRIYNAYATIPQADLDEKAA